MKEIIKAALNHEKISKKQIVKLLKTDTKSPEFYELICAANTLSRKKFENRAMIFAQIGLNAEPCSKNCKFCSMGQSHYSVDEKWSKTADEIETEVEELVRQDVDDIFLMVTADYDFEKFVEIAKRARDIIPENIRLVANIGDFNYDEAMMLKDAGVTGVYHILRLREGIDTDIEPSERIKTLDAIKKAGLELYYCVEPIGPEHTTEELADEMIRARDYGVSVMAVMRRIPVPGTPLYSRGGISAVELTKIAATAMLATLPKRAMNAHEVTPMTLIAGVNQLYAEYGANPRDDKSNTEKGRGYSVQDIRELLKDADYVV